MTQSDFTVKRVFDVGLSAALLTILGLPMLVAGLLVRATSTGPALHWSHRVGRDGKLFMMPKFRSMRTDAPDVATHLLSQPELWITPFGGFLRQTSMDELPQLFSILMGQMSFVGPRPALHNQKDLIALRRARNVLHLSPGLTGWAQVNGRDELSIEAKVDFDAEYSERRSLAFDARIIVMTIRGAFRRIGVAH